MKEQPQKPETLKERIANLEDPGNEREVLIETLIFMNETLESENTALKERVAELAEKNTLLAKNLDDITNSIQQHIGYFDIKMSSEIRKCLGR